mmetsp:Transcript_12082/g.33979  ORF Transcript_12082/g.33979 Transcript_12082/m.33979 type:complete len:249 (-) Transcript_12082:49-795(-)
MEDIMKKSSVKIAPKGRMPPTSEVKSGCENHACSGMALGIALTFTGSSMAGLRKPAYAPKKTKGTDTPNQSTSSANMVVNGTAPEDFTPQMQRFRRKKIVKNNPGYKKAVIRVVNFQRPSSPSKTLQNLADVYPARMPMRVNSSIMDCRRLPRWAGDRRPRTAKKRVTTDMPSTCIPDPTETANKVENLGLRKTSPCTSFQPVSSLASSAVATSLYWVMSRCKVLNMIMATMPDKKTKISREFKMANQ